MRATGETKRELVVSQIEHRPTDRVPYVLPMCQEVIDRLNAHYGGSEWRRSLDDAIHTVALAIPPLAWDTTRSGKHTDLYGTLWWAEPGRPPRMLEPALKRPYLESYRFPTLEEIFHPGWDDVAREELAHDQEHFHVANPFSFGIFERVWALRGFEESMMDAAGDPDFYRELVEEVTDHFFGVIDRLCQLPVDGILMTDDWASQDGVLLGADNWRRLIKPSLAKIYARIHETGKYVIGHCCGGISEILGDLIEIGLDVYESVQPEARDNAPYGLKKRFGGMITFWGGLGSQSTIPFATPAEIKEEIAHLCRDMARGGGYILAPAKELQSDTPVENAVAVVESFLRQESP